MNRPLSKLATRMSWQICFGTCGLATAILQCWVAAAARTTVTPRRLGWSASWSESRCMYCCEGSPCEHSAAADGLCIGVANGCFPFRSA